MGSRGLCRVVPLRRARGVRVRARRDDGGRGRGARAPAPGGRDRAVCVVPRRSIPARALPAWSRAPGGAALAVSAVGALAGDRLVVFGAAAAVGACSTLFRPALQALLPSLARSAKELIAANGASSTIESLGTLLGPLAAGLLVAFADVAAVFAAGAGALLVAAGLLARVSVEGHVPTPRSGSGGEVWQGFRTVGALPRARLIVGLITAQTFVRGCLNVLIVTASFEMLHKGASEVGYLTAAVGAGGLVGALGAVSLRGGRLAQPFGWALVFWGLPVTLIAPLPHFASVMILLAVLGAANSVEDVAGFTLLQRTVTDDVLARVLGVTWGLAMGAVAIGSFVAPAIVSLIGLRLAFLVVGAILPALVLACRPRLIRIDSELAPSRGLGLIGGVTFFAPLAGRQGSDRLASRSPGRRGRRCRDSRRRDRRPLLRRRGRRVHHRRRLDVCPRRPRGLLRRDRAPPRCAADGNGASVYGRQAQHLGAR